MSFNFKTFFDFICSFLGILTLWWVILIAWLIATIETRSNGFFIQKRIGKNGKLFSLIKIKTMSPNFGDTSSITTSNDERITKSGKFFRKTKIDELPQLFNVLIGEMSFVGPRPDVPGYADKLKGKDRLILKLKPGITGPASIKYANEEYLLSTVTDKKKYNDEIIFPDKVRINLDYFHNNTILGDVRIIIKTIFK